MQLTLKQWGNSNGILLPKELMNRAGIKQNDTLEAEVVDGRIILTPGFRHRSLSERISEYGGKLELSEEYDWGEPVGSEVW